MYLILLSTKKLVLEWAWGPPCSSILEQLPGARGYSHNSHSERPPAVGQGALLPQGLGAMHVGDGYEHCTEKGMIQHHTQIQHFTRFINTCYF